MADMIKAVYEPTKQTCWLNMDYVVDVFEMPNSVKAFTFDNERDGYLIDKADYDKWLSDKN